MSTVRLEAREVDRFLRRASLPTRDRYPRWAGDDDGRYELETRWQIIMTGPDMARH